MSIFHTIILTLFPDMFPGTLNYSLAGKALRKNIWSYEIIDIKNFGLTKHRNVDAKPYGGGSGLIMRADVIGPALDKVLSENPEVIIYYPSPRGKLFNQDLAYKISQQKKIVILCGRFEGIDERIIEEYNVEQLSIGNYILSGGEVAASVILDSVIRLLPEVLTNQNTLKDESFKINGNKQQLLEYPLYTKPLKWRSKEVPPILLSGNHEEIKKWKGKQSLEITKRLRPDLLK